MLFKTFFVLHLLFFNVAVFAIGGAGPMDKAKNIQGAKNERPAFMDKVGIEEHLGEQIDLSLPFVDENANAVTLGQYFKDDIPVYMILQYFNCPTLCNTHLNTIVTTLKNFEWQIGQNFKFLVVSFDPKEKSDIAKKKKASYINMYGKPGAEENWHFLTGSQESIDKLTSQIGFKYTWNPNENDWAHTAATYVLTPEGKISYYHYGLNIVPKVFRLSLVEASNNKIGSVMDKILLFCLQYDPNKKTYSFYAYNLMRVVAAMVAIGLGIFFFRFWLSERKAQA